MNKEDIKDILLITKLGLYGTHKFKFLSKRISNERIVKWVTTIIKIFFFAPVSFIYSAMLAFGLLALAGNEYVYLTLYAGIIVSGIFCLFLSIFQAPSYLFNFKDYDMLSAMPIKTSSILTSRVIMLYFSEFFYTGIIFAPNVLAYGIVAKPALSFYLYSLITMFFIPIIPIVIASFIGIIVSYLNNTFKITRIIGLVLTLIFVGFSMSLGFISSNFEQYFKGITLSLVTEKVSLYFPAKMFVEPIIKGDIVGFIVSVLINIALLILFIFIFQNIFKSVNSLLQQKKSKGNYKLKTVSSSSQLIALLKKEIRFYFSMNAYVVNTSAGTLLYLFGMFMMATNLKSITAADYTEISFIFDYLPIVISLIAVSTTALSPTTSVTFSLEAKNIDLLKT